MRKFLKNIILTGILFTTVSANLHSQKSTFPPESYIGFRGGWVASAIHIEIPLESYTYLTEGYSFGISYRSFLQKHVGLQLELNYITKGGYNFYDKDKLSENEGVDTLGLDQSTIFSLNLNYIELPFFMQIRLGKKNQIKINFGSHIGYLISQKNTFTSNKITGEYNDAVDNKTEYGVSLGLGFTRLLGKNTIDLDARYSRSWVNLFKYKSINKSIVNQNQAFIISLSFYFKL